MQSPWALLLLSAFASAVVPDANDVCYSNLRWSSEKGSVVLNGKHPFHIKGTSWFGLETDERAPHGLWQSSLEDIIAFLQRNGFNLLRLPFSVDLLLPRAGSQNPQRPVSIDCRRNPKLCNLSPLELMEAIVDALGDAGILVLLDQHRIHGPVINHLWYTDEYPEEDILTSWDLLLDQLGDRWNLLGLDLKNEPHGDASWGSGNLSTDWNSAAERIIRHIAAEQPQFRGLFFVNGVGDAADTPVPDELRQPHWWGGNLEGVWRHPLLPTEPELAERLVYSPHVYGPDVFRFPYFQAKQGFPANLPAVWNQHFGFVEQLTGRAVVVGEWGGQNQEGTDDREWHKSFADWLINTCHSDNIYWALNPNSGETGGLLLDDWKTARTDKLALLKRVQPFPSFLHKVSGKRFCLAPGDFAAFKCGAAFHAPEAGAQPAPPPVVKPVVDPFPAEETLQTVTVTASPPTPPPTSPRRGRPSTERPPSKVHRAGRPSFPSPSVAFVRPEAEFPVQTPTPATDAPTTAAPRRRPSKPSLQFHVYTSQSWRNKFGVPVREYELRITNLSDRKVCPGSEVRLKTSGLSLAGTPGVWNLNKVEGSAGKLFRLPHWTTLRPGETVHGIGIQLAGDEKPTFTAGNLITECF